MAFHIVRNDIVRMHVDVIVNSANPAPTYAYGTDLAVYTAAGAEELLAERKRIGRIEPGTCAVTSAGKLSARHIIHTVAPEWIDGEHGEFEILRACYENTLAEAARLRAGSVAFPLLATGIYGFPKEKALQIAMSAIQGFLFTHSMHVYLVVFDEASFVLTGRVFDEIQSYVDGHYVSAAGSMEYAYPAESAQGRENATEDEKLRGETLKQLRHKIPRASAESGKVGVPDTFAKEATFQEKLFEYIDKSGLKPSAVYRPIEMSRQQFSKIQCNREYRPKKNTVFLLAIVLRLNLEETTDLLSRAGYAFNPSNKQDVIVKACILNGQYDLYVIDAVMQKNGLDTLIDYNGKRESDT